VFPSIFSYLQFGDQVKGNVIETYADDNSLFIAVRVGFFLTVTLSWPITAPAIGASFGELIYNVNNPIDLFGIQRVVIVVLSNGIPLIIAMFLSEVTPALEVGGAIGGCLGSFLLPAVMYLVHSDKPKTDKWNIVAMVIIVFGALSGVVSTYYAIVGAIDAFSKE
jgi:amino acid permease